MVGENELMLGVSQLVCAVQQGAAVGQVGCGIGAGEWLRRAGIQSDRIVWARAGTAIHPETVTYEEVSFGPTTTTGDSPVKLKEAWAPDTVVRWYVAVFVSHTFQRHETRPGERLASGHSGPAVPTLMPLGPGHILRSVEPSRVVLWVWCGPFVIVGVGDDRVKIVDCEIDLAGHGSAVDDGIRARLGGERRCVFMQEEGGVVVVASSSCGRKGGAGADCSA